jgi:hypothetical protein
MKPMRCRPTLASWGTIADEEMTEVRVSVTPEPSPRDPWWLFVAGLVLWSVGTLLASVR